MANFNPLGYTGGITGSTTRLGVVEFDPVDFSVSESGVVSLGGTGALQTLTGDTGTAIPVAGNIEIAGGAGIVTSASGDTVTIALEGGSVGMDSFVPDAGTNPVVPTALGAVTMAGTANQITTTGGLNTLTFSLPSAITAPGSLTTTTTLAAGTTVTAGTGLIATTGGVTATAGNIAASSGNVSASGTVTGGTGVIATTGGVTATAGDITATAGNVIINGAAQQLRVHGGAVTDFVGTATLVNGTVTVANTNIAATDQVYVTREGINGSTAVGVFNTAITAATSFSITALNPTDGTTQTNDVSTVKYFIVRQV